MRKIYKDNEPSSLLEHRKKLDASYDNYQFKDDLRQSLLDEQGYLCCYCMGRIQISSMKIEHWIPQSLSREQSSSYSSALEIDYRNLLGVCLGNEKARPRFQHCDTKKGNEVIKIYPADRCPTGTSQDCEVLIEYRSDGSIYSNDSDINRNLNETLNLNIEFLKKNRKAAREEILKVLNSRYPNKTWTKDILLKKIQQLKERDSKGMYSPYSQAAINYIEKRLS